MYKKLLLSTLIQQEKRAATLFIFLLLTVVFIVDASLIFIFSSDESPSMLISYGVVLLLVPLFVYFNKIDNPRYTKYILFLSFSFVNMLIVVILNWDIEGYIGGNVAETYFLLFSPIFINRRFVYVVIAAIFAKYVMLSILLASLKSLFPITVYFVFALVILIILSRFFNYLNAINTSFFSQFEGVVKGIISALELKDPYTKGHSIRVAEYAVALAKSLQIYGEDDLKMIYQACLLHDIGKVQTPDHILTKPGKLTKEEFDIVKLHPVLGAQAIKDIQGFDLCRDIVLYHHERWDGKGYPEGLRETQIPITARITAIADSFDAMTTKRSYRDAMSADDAYSQIIDGKGTQFDPALVEYFEKVFQEWQGILSRHSVGATATIDS